MDQPLILSPRNRFGRYLEVCGPGWEARAGELEISHLERVALQREFQGRLVRIMMPAAEIIDTLGAPDARKGTSLRYDLGIRQGLLFDFVMDGEGAVLVECSYSRIEPRRLDARVPASSTEAEGLRRQLITLGATEEELRLALGPPASTCGWWPFETWVYTEALTLELRLGVTE